MKQVRFLISLLVAATLAAGCSQSSPSSGSGSGSASATNAAPDPVYPGLPTEAQPRLDTIKLWIGPEEMTAEMALTPIQEETGMMFRTNMDETNGMIFVLDQPQQASFWMMNCVLPLSAAYIDTDGRIREIRDLQPHNTNAVLSATDDIRFVLETRQGWFQRHNINAGTIVATEKGSLKKTFLNQ